MDIKTRSQHSFKWAWHPVRVQSHLETIEGKEAILSAKDGKHYDLHIPLVPAVNAGLFAVHKA